MDMIGIDLHKRESQLCILDGDGGTCETRIATSRERFTAVLGRRTPARVLLEASTESEWVACYIESLGHDVIVADPNFAPMYATRARNVKTDKRDARTLAEALKLGAYRPAHRVSAERRHVRAELVPLNAQIAEADARIAAIGKTDPAVALLATAPGIGPVTASAIVAVADDIQRFASAHAFEAFLGLVPAERSSGEKRRLGRITKAGNCRARYLLVEAAWRMFRSKSADTAALRAWAQRIMVRRGKRIDAVALARRLAGIAYAMWRDGHRYDATRIRMPTALEVPTT